MVKIFINKLKGELKINSYFCNIFKILLYNIVKVKQKLYFYLTFLKKCVHIIH